MIHALRKAALVICSSVLRVDGFAPATFHQKCDGKGPTVVIAKSAGGHIFGGYTESAWDSSGGWKNCRDSFLFRLSGPGGVGPSQHRIFPELPAWDLLPFHFWTHLWWRK